MGHALGNIEKLLMREISWRWYCKKFKPKVGGRYWILRSFRHWKLIENLILLFTIDIYGMVKGQVHAWTRAAQATGLCSHLVTKSISNGTQ
jgi:hypothetical protein